jgi:prephenate dehydrogenase
MGGAEDQAPLRVAILGVGLIGGSIGLAAHGRAGAQVCGYDPDASVRERALQLGAIQEQAPDIQTAVHGADVVFVAAPVRALAATVGAALDCAGGDCVVSDVGSTKQLLESASRDPRFIGGHPLAGAETAGVEHARADLFHGATWYLTPSEGNTAGVLYERLHRLLVAIGARPTAIDAHTHDRLMACVSHLPHVLANLLVSQAATLLGGDQESPNLPAVGPSFRDSTRVAGANSAIWTDIYMSNRHALIDAIDQFSARLQEVRGWLSAEHAHAVTAWNEQARIDRDALLGATLSGASVCQLRASVPNQPGVIADIALALGRAGVNILDMALAPSQDGRQGEVALWFTDQQQAERAISLIADLGFPVVQA